ncbi:MAG: helix-turn-helix domain-containing protein, partial [Patescibacteria group bacterium]|nr:helix-turn-helix domain-containing protein [Patescibacteria group bacterium]
GTGRDPSLQNNNKILMRQILKQLNFSNKETDVYLAALKLGKGSITELAKKAKIKRPTAYVVLEKLKEMGLVSLSKQKNKQVFIAENPEKLLKAVEEEKEEIIKKEEKIKEALPKFKALRKKDTTVPLIRYYEGKEEIWNIFNDLIESKQDAWIIATGKIYDVLGLKRFMKNVVQRRRQLGTKAYIISDHHSENIKAYKLKEYFREYRFMPGTIDMNSTVYIYDDKVALIFFKEPLSGIIIENKELFLVFKFMFDSLWKELEGKNLPEE